MANPTAKIKAASPFRDQQREEQVLQRVRGAAVELGLDPHPVERLYRLIMEMSISFPQASLGADVQVPTLTGSHDLTTKARALLAETAKAIRVYPDEMIVISGHTDSVGSDQYNQSLSERRARSVTSFLIDTFGISKDRLIAVGYGEEQLKTPQMPEAAENRRVTVVNMSK